MIFDYDFRTTTVITVTGDFRYGTKFEAFKELVEGPRFGNIQMIINLSKVDYMDSDGFKLIKELKSQGYIVNFDIGSYIYKRYLDYIGSNE